MNVFHDIVSGLSDLSQINKVSDVICFVTDDGDDRYYIQRNEICLACDGLIVSLIDDGGWMIIELNYTADQEAFLLQRAASIRKRPYESDCKPCSLSDLLFADHGEMQVKNIEQYFYNGDGPRLPGREGLALQLFAVRLRLDRGSILVEMPHLGGMVVTGGMGDGVGDPMRLYPGQVTVTQTEIPGS